MSWKKIVKTNKFLLDRKTHDFLLIKLGTGVSKILGAL
jgi:hypothetical protein